MAEGPLGSIGEPIFLSSLPLIDLLGRRRATFSMDAVHKAVMGLFPDALPGVPSRRREGAGILWRLDEAPRGKVVLIQSFISPTNVPPVTQVRMVAGGIPLFEAGVALRFRTVVNAVRKERSRVVGAVPKDEMGNWLSRRAGLGEIEVVAHSRDITTIRRHDAPAFQIVIDTMEGVASVADPAALAAAMRHGIGRSRAFGCGLLTVAPLRVG